MLYGKFVKDIKSIPENKRKLYFEPKEMVGIANSEIYGNKDPGLYIYTGEKGQVLHESQDTAISIRLLQDDSKAPPIPPLPDSTRLYKLSGEGVDSKPASIDTMNRLNQLDRDNKIDMSEFKLQVAPLTEDELNKQAEIVASGAADPESKVVVDESNTYIVNLTMGCKIIAVKTLRKSLEKARMSLENEKDQGKKSAIDVFKSISDILQNPEFVKSEAYDEFREEVYGYTYKIHGTERKYGFVQIQNFFDENKGGISPDLEKSFFKLLNQLGHGPSGANGDCLRFDGASQSIYELSRIRTFEDDGKIVTKKTDTLESTTNLNGFAKQLAKLGETPKNKETEEGAEAKEAAPAAAPAPAPAPA
ncbi:MAG: hypothetical protein EBU66_13470, partial [Bacteroidetes bacterium]|nr:hypothetical protein [Bacteroidota bacterium]